MSEFYVYMYFDKNGLPLYVGKGSSERWRHRQKHKSGRSWIDCILLLQGELPCVILHSGLTEEQAFNYEKQIISALGRISNKTGCLVNLTDGGDAPPSRKGVMLSEETKAKISVSVSKSGFKPTSRNGKTFTEEQRAKISAGLKGIKRGPFSEEHKAKLSARYKGKPLSEEVVAARIGRKHSAETMAKMRLSQLARHAAARSA
jgi:hypothetical protein